LKVTGYFCIHALGLFLRRYVASKTQTSSFGCLEGTLENTPVKLLIIEHLVLTVVNVLYEGTGLGSKPNNKLTEACHLSFL
jgi:hypothetical protein